MVTSNLSLSELTSRAWLRTLIVLARVGLGSFFAYAAIAKLYFNGHWHLHDYHFFFAMAIDSYKMLPLYAVQWMARLLPWLELALGTLLVTGAAVKWIASLTSGLLLVFMAALVHAWILKLDIICGCTPGSNETVQAALARDSGLLLLALIVTADAFLRFRSTPSS